MKRMRFSIWPCTLHQNLLLPGTDDRFYATGTTELEMPGAEWLSGLLND